MALPYILNRAYYDYLSDNATHYQLATTGENAGAQSSPASPITAGSLPTYPRGWVARRIYGEVVVSGAVYRTHIPILSPSDENWLEVTNTFSKASQTWTVYGKRGEQRYNKGG
jgi:hypothetical protein